ncbi:MAG: YbaK/EbsC family protein [Egibacteraceae bacterium]
MTAADSGRAERAVIAALDALGADYELIRIDPAYANTAAFCDRYGYPPETSANCIVVASKTAEPRHAACVVQATRRLDVNGTVRRRLGVRKASFAPAEETVALTGMLPDGVTPFGLPGDLPLWVDEDVVAHASVVVGGGSRALKIRVATEAFGRIPGAEVVAGLAKPPG